MKKWIKVSAIVFLVLFIAVGALAAKSISEFGPLIQDGAYVISSEEDSGIKAWATAAKIIYGNRLQVTDGINDEVEINIALRSYKAGITRLSPNHFNIGSSIKIPSRITHLYTAGIGLRGSGMGTIIRLQDGANSNMVEIGDSGTYSEGLTAGGFLLDGNAKGQNGQGGHNGIVVWATATRTDLSDFFITEVDGSGVVAYNARYSRFHDFEIWMTAENGIKLVGDVGAGIDIHIYDGMIAGAGLHGILTWQPDTSIHNVDIFDSSWRYPGQDSGIFIGVGGASVTDSKIWNEDRTVMSQKYGIDCNMDTRNFIDGNVFLPSNRLGAINERTPGLSLIGQNLEN